MKYASAFIVAIGVSLLGFNPRGEVDIMANACAASFQSDLEFLKAHTDAIVLERGKSQVVVVPAYQGRVMTSTAQGEGGASLGWINREAIASKTVQKHINVYGGEDRFWLGPEGGQFGLFFPPGAEMVFEQWQTPAPIDTEPFTLTSSTSTEAVFEKAFDVTNRAGTTFQVAVTRRVALLDKASLKDVGVTVPDSVDCVAYETLNRVTNRGDAPWKKDTGLISVWILGMFPPAPRTTIVIPFRAGSEEELGPKVIDDYFGKVPPERLVVEDDIVYFKGDGKARGKIGINPARSKGIAGSFDADHMVLTLVTYNVPEKHEGYVNSLWEIQEKPYDGDAINSYNDGPVEPGGKPLGPFYELETSSPALALEPGASYEHVSRTIHLVGPAAALDSIARQTLGVGLETITHALK